MALKSLIELNDEIVLLEKEKTVNEKRVIELADIVNNLKDRLYAAQEKKLHLCEIVRLAAQHFPRLRNQRDLTDADYAELDKWIRRVKSNDGLKSIVLALQELSKYKSYDIKSNLYGLVQKIIIEGPNKMK